MRGRERGGPRAWYADRTATRQHNRRIDANHLSGRLNLIWALPLTYHDEIVLHERAVAIALWLRSGAACDAHYLALAEHLGLSFYTANAKLHGPASRLFSSVELVPVE